MKLARRSSLRRWLARLSASLLLLGITAAGAGWLVVEHYAQGLPDVQQLRHGYNPPQVSRIYAAEGTLLFNEFVQRRTVVPFAEVSDVAKLAFLAAEDAHFYEHGGIRFASIARALWVDV